MGEITMKLRFTLIILISTLLSACFGWEGGGFTPAKPYYNWSHVDELKLSTHEWFQKRRQDIIACGLDFMNVSSKDGKKMLCFEERGWYLKEGPVCENELMWDDLTCVNWRKKHSKPNAVPWEPKRDY